MKKLLLLSIVGFCIVSCFGIGYSSLVNPSFCKNQALSKAKLGTTEYKEFYNYCVGQELTWKDENTKQEEIIIAYYNLLSYKDFENACLLKEKSNGCQKRLETIYKDIGMAIPHNFSSSTGNISFDVYYEDLKTKKNSIYSVKKKIKSDKIIDISSTIKKPLNITGIKTKYNIYYFGKTSCDIASSFASEQKQYLSDYKKNSQGQLWLADYTKDYVEFIKNNENYKKLLSFYDTMEAGYSKETQGREYNIINENNLLSISLGKEGAQEYFNETPGIFGQRLVVCTNINTKLITNNFFDIHKPTWIVDGIEGNIPFKTSNNNKFISFFGSCYHGASIENGCSSIDRSLIK